MPGAVVIVTAPSGRVLGIRRSRTDPRWPLAWNFPGGMIEQGENPLAGAIRETHEETGKLLGPSTLRYLGEPTPGVHVFQGFVSSEYIPRFMDSEHDRFVWTRIQRLPRPWAGGVGKLIQALTRKEG